MIHRLFEHMWWADAKLIHGLEALHVAPKRAVNLYAHVVATEIVWYDRIHSAKQSVPVWPQTTLTQCVALARKALLRGKELLAPCDPEFLARPCRYQNSAGKTFVTEIGDILIHVAVHGAYHRGQIAMDLRQNGQRPVSTDFIEFVRGVPAATQDDRE